jgi:hypothetical protein
MKSFKGYLTEFAQQSTSDYVFDTHSVNSSSLKIPISGPMFKRIWPDTIRTTVFHTTDLDGLGKLKKLEGGKKSISAFFSMMSRYMETGVATSGDIHVVVEMEADILVSAKDDVWSQVDNKGRRWVEVGWFANATRTGPEFGKFEKDLDTLIANLVKKHVPKEKGKPFEVWMMMKSHLKAGREGGGKRLSLVIKDYFDGIERVIKKNKEVLGGILYGYAKGKRMTDNAWDEQIVNNIEITKVHIWPDNYKEYKEEDEDEIKQRITDIKNWPIKSWDASIDVEIYTREVAQAEREMMKK